MFKAVKPPKADFRYKVISTHNVTRIHIHQVKQKQQKIYIAHHSHASRNYFTPQKASLLFNIFIFKLEIFNGLIDTWIR